MVINTYAFWQLLSNVYFECFYDHSAIAHIMNSKKIATGRIQRLIEHLLPFNFSVYYLPGEKMHIVDILSPLAGKDLNPPDKIIPISFNVKANSSRSRKFLHPEKLPIADKHKPSQIGYIPASQLSQTTKGSIKKRQIR